MAIGNMHTHLDMQFRRYASGCGHTLINTDLRERESLFTKYIYKVNKLAYHNNALPCRS